MLFEEQVTPPPPNLSTGPGVEMPPGWRLLPPESPPALPHRNSRRPDITGIMLLLLLLVFHITINVYWLHADHHSVYRDEAHHIQRSEAFYKALFSEDTAGVFARVLGVISIESPYPPLSQLLGATTIQMAGDAPDRIALSGSIALALLLLGVYALARLGMAAHNALLTATITSFVPLIFGYARLVMPDTLCGALVVWALYGLVRSDFFRRTGWTAFTGIFCGLALLTHQTALVYLAFPVLLAFLVGLVKALIPQKLKEDAEEYRRWPRILFNAGLCALLVTAVCSWWYCTHLEYLYTWWSTQRGHDSIFQPGIASRLADTLPAVTESPEARIALDPAISGYTADAGKAVDSYPFTSFLEPYRLFWKRYLIYLVNEVTFLPLALAALAGLPALLLKRNRNALSLLVTAWPVGAYVLLTGLFSLHSPRFLYGIAAAPAFFAVYALNAIPFVRLRRALSGLLLVLLVLQFINLTLVPFGPIKRVEIPVLTDEPEVRLRDNAGITVYKDLVRTGHYILHAPYRGQRPADVVLKSMAAHESARPAAASDGAAVWYQEVSPVPPPLGLDFYARRYIPAAGGEQLDAQRSFAPIKPWSSAPEDTLPELAETTYVVLYQPLEGDYVEALERKVAFFLEHGFKSILNHPIDEKNPADAGFVHVLARREFPVAEEIDNLFDIYSVLVLDGKNFLLPEEERTVLEERYTGELQRYTEDIQALNDHANLLGFHVETASKDWFLVRLIIHASEVPDNNYRIWMRAHVREGEKERLLGPQQEKEVLIWDFDPSPPASQWKRNQALVFTRPVMAHPLYYQVEIGLYDPEKEERPASLIETEWVDFSAVD